MNKLGAVIGFAVVQLITCFLAWIGGYDFDRRGFDVSAIAMFSVFVGIAAAVIGATFPKEDQ